MDVVTILIVVVLIGVVGSSFVDLSTVKKMFAKEDKEPDIVVIPGNIPTPEPKPVPNVIYNHDTSIVGIVNGWNCFKNQCERAELTNVVDKLEEIFPMLMKADVPVPAVVPQITLEDLQASPVVEVEV